MDFFEQQDKKRNSSWLLLLLFTIAVTVLTVALAWAVSILNNIIALEQDKLALTPIGMMVAGFFGIAVLFGCFFRWLDVRGGGARLAQRFGSTEVDPSTRDYEERQLLSVAAEMAVAASIAEPKVFIMRREHVINAFVVGGGDDIALVVTSGAVHDLDRDELQAVVGHEMGHIVNGDLTINMRLLIVLGGFMALNEVGDTIGENFVGSIFRILGSICVFTGSLIRAAFSRRREFLADAMAVQFTRNPDAMASALNTVQEHHDPETLECRYRQELAHLCFNGQVRKNWFARKLATHPRLQDRIHAIDPLFSAKNRSRERKRDLGRESSNNDQNLAAAASGIGVQGDPGAPGATQLDKLTSHPGIQVLAGSMTMAAMSGGNAVSGKNNSVTQLRTAFAANASGASPVNDDSGTFGCRMDLMVPDAKTALAAIFALFASEGKSERQAYLNSIAFAYKKPFADKVGILEDSMGEEFRRNPLQVLQHASNKLRAEVKPENRRHLLLNLEKLIEIEHETTLVNFACLTLLRRWLNVEYPVLKTNGEQSVGELAKNHNVEVGGAAAPKNIPRVNEIGTEIGLLLSLLLEASGNRSERNLEDYRRVMLSYTDEVVALRSQHEKGIVTDMQVAFESVQAQHISFRQAFVAHCREVVVADFQVTDRENLLLTLFATALEVEMPSEAGACGFNQAANF